jgi:hypothetical protein
MTAPILSDAFLIRVLHFADVSDVIDANQISAAISFSK